MQTFLPFRNYVHSVRILDDKRLNKQILECYQLHKIYTSKDKKSYSNHPAFLMWVGHGSALALYGLEACKEFYRRKDKNKHHIYEKYFQKAVDEAMEEGIPIEKPIFPEELYESHRSNLYYKDKEYYKQFEKASDKLLYVWTSYYKDGKITQEGIKSLYKTYKRRMKEDPEQIHCKFFDGKEWRHCKNLK